MGQACADALTRITGKQHITGCTQDCHSKEGVTTLVRGTLEIYEVVVEACCIDDVCRNFPTCSLNGACHGSEW